jgi:hypothetical protein
MEWTEVITTFITALSSVVVSLITAGYIRKRQDKVKEKQGREKLMYQIQRDELIHFTLREIRRKFNVDRVYIIQFHNGGSFYTQTPMQKASVSYERCSDGLESMADKFQNVLVSHHTWYITEIINSKAFYSDVDNQINDLPTRSWLKNYGNYSHSAVPIYDGQKNLIAILCVSWVFSDIPTNIIDENKFKDEFKTQLYDDANSLKPFLV